MHLCNTGSRLRSMLLTTLSAVLFIAMIMPIATVDVYAAAKAPGAPKVTSATVTQSTVTLKWKKAKRAKKYQVGIYSAKKRWNYVKKVKKTKANKRKYSVKGKYKVVASGRRYKVYRYSNYFYRMKTVKSRSYKFTGLKDNSAYRFGVRAVNGKRKGKWVMVNRTTAKKPSSGAGIGSGASETVKPGGPVNPESVKTSIVKEESTKIVDQGWIKFVAITFEDGYSKDNCIIEVDGTDVSDVVTNVTDDGSIAKWELEELNPAAVTVTSKADSNASETVKLSDNKNPVKPEKRARAHADYVMGHAPVSVFDYYLTNYDDQGNIRTMPSKTTFAVKADKTGIRSYSEEAELKSDGTGEVVVMFNYKSDEDRAWFDAVADEGAVELVSFDEQKTTISSSLRYTKDTEYPHGSGTVAAIKIALGQPNFTNNGRYYIRTKSTGNMSALTSIHVVNETAPTMLINENGSIRSGQNIHFHIDNMVEGIKESIEEVTLTTPSGKTKTLEHIDDWFHFGNTGLFVIYNDTERDDGKGVNNTEESGVYTVTVKAAGFKTFSKKFEVIGGTASKTTAKLSAMKVDAMSGASAVVDDSGSGGSGGSKVSANLLFDVDLLANALIMDELKMDNAYATAIAERWLAQVIPDYVFMKDGLKFHTWTEYVNAVSDSKLNDGKYLTYSEYASMPGAKTTETRPSRIKAVLEDNMLGDITDKYLGVSVPELTLTGEFVEEGKDAEFICSDQAYLNAIKQITPADDTRPLDKSYYSISGNKLIISSKSLKLGEGIELDNVFDIRATGYKETSVVVPYKKVLENVSLKVLGDSHKAGEDVTVLIEGSKGDFLKNLISVHLGEKQIYNASQGGTSGNRYYEINTDKTEITLKEGNFPAEGTYTLKLKAQYYDEQTIDITMDKKEDISETEAPAVKSVSKSGSKISVTFEGNDSDVAAYLRDIRSVKVGDVQYEKALLGLGYNSVSQYSVGNDPTYGGPYVILSLSWADGFSSETDNVVELTTNSYKVLKFTVTGEGTLPGSGGTDEPDPGTGGDDPDPNPDPGETGEEPPAALRLETVSKSDWLSSYKYYYVVFDGSEEKLAAYFDKITAVEVGGYEYSKLSDYEYLSDASGNKYKRYSGSYGRDYHLGLTAGDGFTAGAQSTITIKADGYKTIEFTATPAE